MKIFSFLIAVFFATATFADTEVSDIVDSFVASKLVQEALETTSQEIRRVHGYNVKLNISKPTAVLLRYSCGAKGCITRYLVTTMIVPRTINAQGKMVAAFAYKMGKYSTGNVRVLNSSQLKRLTDLSLFPDN